MNQPCLLKTLALFFAAALAPAAIGQDADAPKEDFSDTFREALFAEEAENDIETAIVGYRQVIEQFSDLRKIAASAVFRLGECYRKQGKNDEAAVQYRWLLAEFPEGEIEALAKLSRENLAALGMEAPEKGMEGGGVRSGDPEVLEIARLKKLFETSPDRALEIPTPLYTAAMKNQLKVAAYLVEQKVDLSRGNGTVGPLAAAAAEGNLQMVNLLAEAGADIDGKPDFSPLVIAIQNDREQVVRRLVALGADLNWTRKGNNPLTAALEGEWQEADHLRYVQILDEAGADLSATIDDRANDPLIIAAGRGLWPIVSLLLERGADPNAIPKGAPTSALIEAVAKGEIEMVEMLLDKDADPNLLVGSKVMTTAMHQVYRAGDSEKVAKILDLLMNTGGDLLSDVGSPSPLAANQDYLWTDSLQKHFFDIALRSIPSEDLAERIWITHGPPPGRGTTKPVQTPLSKSGRRRVVIPVQKTGRSFATPTFEPPSVPDRIRRFGNLVQTASKSESLQAPPRLAGMLLRWESPWDSGSQVVGDLSRIRIHRRRPEAMDGAFDTIGVDLFKDVGPQLQWGDVVEIPPRGILEFDSEPGIAFVEAAAVAVTVRLGEQDSKLRLWPGIRSNFRWVPGDAAFLRSFDISQLALATRWKDRYDLDLDRAMIRRELDDGEHVIEGIFDLEADVPILNGDVIEIPLRDPRAPETITQRKRSLWISRPDENLLMPILALPETFLTDVLAELYGRPAGRMTGDYLLTHPDFSKIRVRQLTENGESIQQVDLTASPGIGEAAFGPELDPGAIIEIPSLAGVDQKTWEGLPKNWVDFLDSRSRIKVMVEPEGFSARQVENGYRFNPLQRHRFGWGAPKGGRPRPATSLDSNSPFLHDLFTRHLSTEGSVSWDRADVDVVRGEVLIKVRGTSWVRLRDGDRVIVKRKL